MGNVATLKKHTDQGARSWVGSDAVDYLGPATVLAAHLNTVDVQLPGHRRVQAKLALAMPYRPVVGDELLVVSGSDNDEHWVIGVVHGKGSMRLEIPGDVDLRAVGGKLRLGGDAGVHIDSREITLSSEKLRIVANSLFEKLTTAVTRVQKVLSVQAGERHTVVEGNSLEKAKRATILTEETVSINGKAVHLG